MISTLSESDQYSSAPKEISKLPLVYMTGYFCRSVYIYCILPCIFTLTERTILVPFCVARNSEVFNIFHKKPKGLQGDVAI